MSAHTKGPTLEEMHAAWLRRKKPQWPASFEEAMEHPVYMRLLQIECIRKSLSTAQHGEPHHIRVRVRAHGRRMGYWMDTDADKDP